MTNLLVRIFGSLLFEQTLKLCVKLTWNRKLLRLKPYSYFFNPALQMKSSNYLAHVHYQLHWLILFLSALLIWYFKIIHLKCCLLPGQGSDFRQSQSECYDRRSRWRSRPRIRHRKQVFITFSFDCCVFTTRGLYGRPCLISVFTSKIQLTRLSFPIVASELVIFPIIFAKNN